MKLIRSKMTALCKIRLSMVFSMNCIHLTANKIIVTQNILLTGNCTDNCTEPTVQVPPPPLLT